MLFFSQYIFNSINLSGFNIDASFISYECRFLQPDTAKDTVETIFLTPNSTTVSHSEANSFNVSRCSFISLGWFFKIVNKIRTNAKQAGDPPGTGIFNISLSGNGLRLAVGSSTEIDIYNLSDRLRTELLSFDTFEGTYCQKEPPDFK